MALAPGKACYVPLRHGAVAHDVGEAQGGLNFSAAAAVFHPQIPLDVAMDLLRPVFEDPAVLKIGHNLKYDSHVLLWPRNGGVKLRPVDDTMCLSYVLDGGRVGGHSMDYLAKHNGLIQLNFLMYVVKGQSRYRFVHFLPKRR